MGANKFGFMPVFIMSQAEFDDVVSREGSAIYSVINECSPLQLKY